VTGSRKSDIKNRITSGNMPEDVSLSQADINRILAWYNPPCNAPQ
jgi:hypothetical protein